MTPPGAQGLATPKSVRTSNRAKLGNIAGSETHDMSRHRRFMVAIDLYSHDSSNREMCGWMLEHMIRPGDDIVLVHCIVPLPMQAVYALPDGRLVSNADILKVLEMQDLCHHFLFQVQAHRAQFQVLLYDPHFLLSATRVRVERSLMDQSNLGGVQQA